MSFRAPVEDILFNLVQVAPGPGSLPASADTIEQWRTVLEQAAGFVEAVIAPLNRVGDIAGSMLENGVVRTPAGWREGYRAWCDAGWLGAALPARYGGIELPTTVGTAVMEMFTSACMALSTLHILTQGAVEALDAHADDALRRLYLPKLIAGTWAATMNLTEPHAGSDLALMRTRAEPTGTGTYRIFGQKVFITFGEHDLADNIVHLVLARLPNAPAGTRGITLFLVPKYLVKADGSPGERNDIRCISVEHKLGIRASPTCTMAYGDEGGAIGWLVGKPNDGLASMFTMMNKARLATGLQGVAVAERAYQQALAYAQERRQGKAAGHGEPAPIIAHADVRRMLGRMKALTMANRALAYFIAAAIEDARNGTDEFLKRRGRAYADLLTPVFKAFATDSGVETASLGIQVHGGLGYIEETGAAQHWRDARVAPVYEGTNGIQAIDLVTRKVTRDRGEAMRALMAECRAILDAVHSLAPDRRSGLAPVAAAAGASLDDLAAATDWLLGQNSHGEPALYAATSYLRLAGITLGATLMVKGATAAARLEAEPVAGRREYVARRATAMLFVDEFAAETAGLKRRITMPTASPHSWADALGVNA